MASKPLTMPTIHLNGTHPNRLLDALANAYDALSAAYDALKETAPNGRDYYTQPGDALGKATAEHMSRLQRVDDVSRELESICEAIQDQRDAVPSTDKGTE